jgi:hypothetical protein
MWFCWEHSCQLAVWMINKWFVTICRIISDLICSLHCLCQTIKFMQRLIIFSDDQPCSRSLNKQHVSLGVFDKCCLLTNFLQENGRYAMIQRSWTIGVASSILRFSGWSGKSLHKEKTQVRICWIIRSHRGQGWLDTHILLFYHIEH